MWFFNYIAPPFALISEIEQVVVQPDAILTESGSRQPPLSSSPSSLRKPDYMETINVGSIFFKGARNTAAFTKVK